MVNKVIYALICFLMLATFANAQPNITSTSGTYAHNSTVTISGNNFGSKLTGPPVCWDNCESGTPGDKWNYRPSSSSGALGSYGKYGDYRDKVTIDGWGSPYGGAPNPPHNFSNKYYCANTYTTGGGGETQQDECSLGKIVGDVDHAYFSFYYRVDNDWTFNSGSDFNHKMMSISGGSAAYSSPYVYWEFRCDRINSSNVGIRDHGMASCAITSCDQVTSMLNSPRGNWVKLEYIFNFSSNGFQKAVADNRTVFHRSSCQVVSFSKNFIGIGGYHRDYGSSSHNAANWRYFDDIYFDTTLSRVMLANNSNYDNATIIEPQIPSAWSNNSITINVNQASFAVGETAYLFVFDADGNANTQGYPTTFILSGFGPPNPPTGLKIK